MKTFLLYGEEPKLIEKELEKIKKFYKEDLFMEAQVYDLHETSISNVLLDVNTSAFFGMKMIIVKNALFIKNINSYEIEHDFDDLIKYLSNQNEQSILIFIAHVSEMHKRQRVTKAINEYANVKYFPRISENDLTKIIHKIVLKNNIQIDTKNIKLIIELVGINFSLVYQEVEKLMLYKNFVGEISQKDIYDVVSINLESDVFKLIELIMKKEKKEALNLFERINSQKDESLGIIALMVTQLRLIYQVEILASFKEQEIASKLGVHPYRVKLAKNNFLYDIKDVFKELTLLNDLEFKIKTGKIVALTGLKMHILNK